MGQYIVQVWAFTLQRILPKRNRYWSLANCQQTLKIVDERRISCQYSRNSIRFRLRASGYIDRGHEGESDSVGIRPSSTA